MTISDMSPISSNSQFVGSLSRPWRRVGKPLFNPETVLAMARINCKVYANLGFTRRSSLPFAVFLDTGAVSRFIRKGLSPQGQ